MKFREFASIVKASAADVAQKIPTFDDMAAKDEYIHSEEFNVTGQNAKWKVAKKRLENQEKIDSEDALSKASQTSLHSSVLPEISRLSQPKNHRTFGAQENITISTNASDSTTSRIQNNRLERSSLNEVESQASTNRSASLPLLSVVVDTLESSSAQSLTSGLENESDSCSDIGQLEAGSDSSDDDDDEEDPIMSMIRKSGTGQSNSAKRKRSRKRPDNDFETFPANNSNNFKQPQVKHDVPAKNPKRFMDDLDRRLSNPENSLEDFIDTAQRKEGDTQAESIRLPDKWGWMKNFASSKINTLLKRPDALNVGNRQSMSKAPLSRLMFPKSLMPQRVEENFDVAVSSSVLKEDELLQLKKMKTGGTVLESIRRLFDLVKKNQQFSFIAFTMVLAVVVYFLQGTELLQKM